MQSTYLLEDIFGTRGRVVVLRALAGVGVPLSIRQVARQAGLSHVAAASTLNDLVGMGLVATTVVGRSRVHWLEHRNLYVERVVLPALSAEAEMPDSVAGALKDVLPKGLLSAVLFGSYARGEQSAISDIDLLIVARNDADVAAALAHVDSQSAVLRAKLGARVSVLGYTLRSAVRLQADGDNLMDGVTRDGIVVAGLSPREWSTHAKSSKNRST